MTETRLGSLARDQGRLQKTPQEADDEFGWPPSLWFCDVDATCNLRCKARAMSVDRTCRVSALRGCARPKHPGTDSRIRFSDAAVERSGKGAL